MEYKSEFDLDFVTSMAEINVDKELRLKAQICDCPEGFMNRYDMEMEKVIGGGMSGPVFVAYFNENPRDKRAVKTFSSKGIDKRRMLEMFVREISILQNIKHKHILSDVTVSRPAYII